MQVLKSQEKQESGFPSWDDLSWGKLKPYEWMRVNKEEDQLRSEWRAYNWDRLVAQSTLDHKKGYIPEDVYGLCTRTIKKCELEMKLIIEQIRILREDEARRTGGSYE